MTTIKLSKIVMAIPSLQYLANLKFRKTSVGFKLATFARKALEHSKEHDEQRKKLLEEYGILDEKKQQYTIPEENRETFNQLMIDLNNTEITDLVPPSVDLTQDLKEGIGIRPSTLAPLNSILFNLEVPTTEMTLTRAQLLDALNTLHNLGTNDIKNVTVVTKILYSIDYLASFVEAFQKEEQEIAKTETDMTALGTAISDLMKLEGSYNLPTYRMEDFDDMELEPAIFLGLEKLLTD